MLRDAWDRHAAEWIMWARAPGHDSYWRFHRDAFLDLVPAPGRLTLDLGCGEGRLGRDLARLGHRVLGLDVSPTMTRAAVTHPDRGGPVVLADAARLPLTDQVADCAVAFMSLQDVDDMELAVREAARVLAPGGHFVLAITHAANTAGRFVPGPVESERPFQMQASWFERRATNDTCERDGLTMTFHSEHRPIQAYTDAVADAGLLIERLREVTTPDPEDKWYRMPLFLHLRAMKPGPAR